MRRLDIEELHQRLLNIAKEFHRICEHEHIPYYMVGGTMLGAIRHKGFIPWDDDMDFAVPIEHYNRMIEVMRRRLPEGLLCTTFDSNVGNQTPFVKISETATRIEDPTRRLLLDQQLGLNIDVFPLIRCEKNDGMVKKVKVIGRIYTIVFSEPLSRSLWKKYVKKALRLAFPFSYKRWLSILRDNLFRASNSDATKLANLCSPYGLREIMPQENYGIPNLYAFEDTMLYGVELPHKYLIRLYGDTYMTPPPEGQRRIHADNVYLWQQ